MQRTLKTFNAGGSYALPSWDPRTPDVWQIRACHIDDLSLLGPPCPDTAVPNTLAKFFEASARTVDLFCPYPTGIDVVEAFWRTMIADTYSREHPAADEICRLFIGFCLQSALYLRMELELSNMKSNDDYVPSEDGSIPMAKLVDKMCKELGRDSDKTKTVLLVNDGHYVLPIEPMRLNEYAPGLYNIFTLGIFQQITLGNFPKEYLENTNGAAYRSAMGRWCQNRRFFVTEKKGYFGLGPRSLESGDGVFLLEGGSVPFVLRRNADGMYRIGTFFLFGDAYVHGIMHGEALEADGSDWQQIQIC